MDGETHACKRRTLLPRSRMRAVGLLVVIAIALLIASRVAYVTYQHVYNIWWRPPSEIKAYLLTQTPVGSRETQVLAWLDSHDISAEVHRFPRKVEPTEWRNYSFAISQGATAMIQEVVAQYGFPFGTSVEAFYLFDEGRLVDIGVRKTTDAF